jgi:hypothetical protein
VHADRYFGRYQGKNGHIVAVLALRASVIASDARWMVLASLGVNALCARALLPGHSDLYIFEWVSVDVFTRYRPGPHGARRNDPNIVHSCGAAFFVDQLVRPFLRFFRGY